MDTSFGLLFHLKKSKNFKADDPYVYMRITVEGCASEVSTKRKCNPNAWKVSSGRMKARSDNAKTFNAYLNTLQQRVFEAKRKLIEIDKELTAENIKNLVLGKPTQTKHMLLEILGIITNK